LARQFEVWRLRENTLVVIVQSDLLETMRTPRRRSASTAGRAGRTVRVLNPEIEIDGANFVLMPQLLATLTLDPARRTSGLGRAYARSDRARDRYAARRHLTAVRRAALVSTAALA